MQNAHAQELDIADYQWKNRILLVVADDGLNQLYQKQFEELRDHKEQLVERRLLTVEVIKDKYKVNDGKSKWMLSNALYKNYSNPKMGFQVLLIGLDGGVKVKKYDVFKAQDLFDKIDAMPMRLSELRAKNHDK